MARGVNQEAQQRWRDRLRRFSHSALSVTEFCRREQVSEPSFYAWRKRLLEPVKSGREPAVANRRQQFDDGPLFVPVKLLDNAPAMEIIHPLGYRIQLTGEVNPVALRRVIETLDERAAR